MRLSGHYLMQLASSRIVHAGRPEKWRERPHIARRGNTLFAQAPDSIISGVFTSTGFLEKRKIAPNDSH